MKQKTSQDVRVKILGVVIAGALVLGGILYMVQLGDAQDQNTAESSSVLEAERSHVDIGDIDIFGGTVDIVYAIKNTGDQDVTVVEAETSCGCTEGNISGKTFGMHDKLTGAVTVPAGQTIELVATFDPLAHGPNATGKITRELILETNSKEQKELRVRFSTNVVKL